MARRRPLDSVIGNSQTAPAPPAVVLVIEPDPTGEVMAEVVRIILEEMREHPEGGTR